jgi:hypothetical protein
VSLYTDDAAIFISPSKTDIAALKRILYVFGQVSGLRTNLQKYEVYPIGCADAPLDQILEAFPPTVKSFLCHYLRLPLHQKKLRRIDFLPLIDKVGGKLPSWKDKLMSMAARAQLVKSVLTSVVTYHATVFNLPKWLIKKIDKFRRKLFWKGEDSEGNKGGACLVKWDIACRPKDLGGLGFHNLKCFGRALHQRWFWYHWADDTKPWQGMHLPCDDQDLALFQASTEIKIGDGVKALFWHDRWLEGGNAPKDLAPHLFKLAHLKNRTVTKELKNNNWIQAVHRISTTEELLEFINLWMKIKSMNFNQGGKDEIIWKWTPNGEYTARSAYRIQFDGSHPSL